MNLYSALYDEFFPFDGFLSEWKRKCVGPDDDLKGPGALIIWGGSDIHPSLYLRDNIHTYSGNSLSLRDAAEAKLFAKAVDVGLIILGICRGAQLGCALTGGILVQHVTGHERDHLITTIDNKTFSSSSLHHQMMYPWGVEHDLIAWSNYPKSSIYEGVTDSELERWSTAEYGKKQLPIEPEIVWFPTTKCLAIQGHPEMMPVDCFYNRYIETLTREKCGR